MSGRWIRPGLRYHQQGPGLNIRCGRTQLAALAENNKEKERPILGQRKDRPSPEEGHTCNKESPDCFCFFTVTFAFFFTPFFYDIKGIKIKEEKTKIK
jgi:hypothetical protein